MEPIFILSAAMYNSFRLTAYEARFRRRRLRLRAEFESEIPSPPPPSSSWRDNKFLINSY